jgi:transposase
MNNIKCIGIDLAKEIFYLHGVDKNGLEVFRKKLSRKKFVEFMHNIEVDRNNCVIGMEACTGANYFAKRFREFGYKNIRIVPAQFVKPYVKSNKNDAIDASAIVKAVLAPDMRFANIKEYWQQDIINIHRVRSRLVKQRTALGNEIRGLFAEYGKTAPKTISKLKQRLTLEVNGEVTNNNDLKNINIANDLTLPSKELFNDLLDELSEIENKIKKMEWMLKDILYNNDLCKKLIKIPGIGIISSTALVAELGNASNFKNGRELSSYLGLVPKQNSSGGKNKLLGISKRGNKYLRTLLIHGSRAVMYSIDRSKNLQNSEFCKNKTLSKWLCNLRLRKNTNVAVIALANKIARICFVVLSKDQEYLPNYGN